MRKKISTPVEPPVCTMTRAYITEIADYDIRYWQKDIEKFAADVVKDAAHALKWSGEVFRLAARLETAKQLRTFINDGLPETPTLHHMRVWAMEAMKHFSDKAMREARYPTRSTSVGAVEIAREEASTCLEMVELLKRWVAANDQFEM